jgi:hypothetical protein
MQTLSDLNDALRLVEMTYQFAECQFGGDQCNLSIER